MTLEKRGKNGKNYKPCEKLVLPCDREVKDRHEREIERERSESNRSERQT